MTNQPQIAPTCYRHEGRETWIRCQRCERPICPDCMVAASVGFQCPTCVKEGTRATRSARTAYGGQLSENPALTSMVLIGINALVWVAILVNGGDGSRLVDKLALLPASAVRGIPGGGALLVQGVNDGAWWQLVTSMFTHVSPLHIGFNMLALYFLGPQLELLIGRARFLALYFLSGLTGSALVMWASAQNGQTLGASGAIFGLLGALLVVGLKVGADMQQIWMWLGLNLVFTFVASGISWQGHVGGLVGGVVVSALIAYAPRKGRTTFQALALSGVLVVTVALILVRAAAL